MTALPQSLFLSPQRYLSQSATSLSAFHHPLFLFKIFEDQAKTEAKKSINHTYLMGTYSLFSTWQKEMDLKEVALLNGPFP